MNDEEMGVDTAERGKRLETYMYGLMPEGVRRSRSELARVTHVSRQQLIQWFDGKGEPRLSALEEAARALNVRRVDLVAAYDGVTAPETEKAPRPEWAEGLEDRIAEEMERRLTADASPLAPAIERLAVQLGLLPSPGVEGAHEKTVKPPGTGDTDRQLSA